MTSKVIDVYDTGYGSQIGKISIDKQNSNSSFTSTDVHTIVILDISGSMSSYVTKLVNHHLPNTLIKMGYKANDKVTLITFGSTSDIYNYTIKEFRDSNIRSNGCTYMNSAIKNLGNVISNSHTKKIRMLTISDGELNDQQQTLDLATKLAKNVSRNYNIHSSAIRLFTSLQQPDTRGLASVLQFNNVGNSQLIDFRCPSIDEEFINVFCSALTDNLGSNIKLVSDNPIFMANPWDTPQKEIQLSEGENTFWLSNPNNDTTIKLYSNNKEDILVTLNKNSSLDFNNFQTILKEKIDYYVKRLKLLKIIDLKESKDEIEKIVNYFTQLEKIFSMNDKSEVDLNKETSIKSRLQFFKKYAFRKSKSIVQELATIANQDKVSQLNSAQQADYLRNATTSTNTVNLAKRGLKQGFDFDVKAIQEVKNMRAHLHEISDINDSDHTVSFYSQETTLSGIKAVCSLVDDGSVENLGALEILQLLNIVGVPCDAAIGDFPDPKTYHISDLMLGIHISMSDIMVTKQLGQPITHPFNKKIIVNTIPFYDDDRIQQFLIKYAPNLLEYTASLGMRNMIINIPNSYNYTIVDGVWWMTRVLQDNPSEVNAKLFIKFVHTYKTSVGKLFDYVPNLIKPMLEEDKKNNLSLYIGNNGVTNMIGPLIAIQNDPEKMKMVPDILRALYTFEFYQVLRKYYRLDSDGYIKRKQMLDDLLGIDFNKYASSLPSLFESQKVPIHYAKYHVNEKIYDDVNKRVFWVDYICQMPKMFEYALNNDVKSLTNVNSGKGTHEKELNINFDLTKFKLLCMVQGLMFDTLASRYDDKTDKMKIEDAGDEKRMDDFISDYIRRQYHANYQSELSKQNKREIEVLTGILVEEMVNTDNIKDFNELFKNGLTKNHVSVAITDSFKDGFDSLKTKLFDPNVNCPARDKKLKVLVMACNASGDIIYNKGNTLRMPITTLEELFTKAGCHNVWTSIKDEYVQKSIHLYRESNLRNRHDHANDKPSYFAYGFNNLGAYFATINKTEQAEYCKIHTHCCGIWDGKPYRWA